MATFYTKDDEVFYTINRLAFVTVGGAAKTFITAFAQTSKTNQVLVTNAVAGLNTSTPTNTVKLLRVGTRGAIVTKLWAIATSTTERSNLCVWISKDAGITKHLIDSKLAIGHTVGPVTENLLTIFEDYSENTPLRLEAGDEVYVGSMKPVNGIIFYAKYKEF